MNRRTYVPITLPLMTNTVTLRQQIALVEERYESTTGHERKTWGATLGLLRHALNLAQAAKGRVA